MHRSLAIFFALILATLSIATTGFAAESGPLRFELSGTARDRLQLALTNEIGSRNRSSTSVVVSDLAGFDRALLARDGQPVQFAFVREPGRLDCSGRTDKARARGTCRFSGDPAFASFLASTGMRRPTEKEWLTLTMVGARRDLVQALQHGRFAMPYPDTLAGMTALGVTPDYIRGMAAAGYRPRKTEDFIPLKALDITPAYIGSLKRVGYDRVPVEDIIQLKALGITAEFIADYQRHGFRDLSVSRLVQLKALGIRPKDIGQQTAGRPMALSTVGGDYAMAAMLP